MYLRSLDSTKSFVTDGFAPLGNKTTTREIQHFYNLVASCKLFGALALCAASRLDVCIVLSDHMPNGGMALQHPQGILLLAEHDSSLNQSTLESSGPNLKFEVSICLSKPDPHT